MAILNVNATRMELNKLKKRLLTARKGHKLLKNKSDGLLIEFIKISKQTLKLQKEVYEEFKTANLNLKTAKIKTSKEEVMAAFSISKQNVIKIIENDNSYCNDILNLYDLKNNFLIIANRNSEIKVIKNNRIIQDIKNAQNDSIYGIIQINNETIASYSMWTIQLWKIKK